MLVGMVSTSYIIRKLVMEISGKTRKQLETKEEVILQNRRGTSKENTSVD